MENDVPSLIFRLVAARQRLLLSQRMLAERSGISESHIRMIERGKTHPSIEIFARFADAVGLEVTLTELKENDGL